MTTRKQAAATDAAAQLKRLLAIVPRIADGEEHSIASIAEMLGVSAETVANDLVSVGERYDTPGGFIEGLQVFIEAQKVSVRTGHFLRPMRLTVAELHALDLGLAMIRAERPAEEWATIEKARERIRSVAAKLPKDSTLEAPYAAAATQANPHLPAVRGLFSTDCSRLSPTPVDSSLEPVPTSNGTSSRSSARSSSPTP